MVQQPFPVTVVIVGARRCAVTDDVLTACASALTALSALDLTSCKQVCREWEMVF